MDRQTYDRIAAQLKSNPGSNASAICEEMGIPAWKFHQMKSKLKLGKKKKEKTTAVQTKKMSTKVFSVPTVTPTARTRVFVVACWADELESVLKGLQ